MRIKMKAGSLAAIAISAMLATVGCASTSTQRSAGETVDDSVITARVKAELIDNDTTKARQINVETYRGVVQLNGFVDSQTAKDAATKVARSVNGVQEVHNNLTIKASTGTEERTAGTVVDDASLTAKVKTALIDNPTTKARSINVTTYSGVVQLSGFVNSADEKQQAADVARSVSGVKEVRNELEVKAPPQP